jgi:hypothetical protein
MITSMRPMARLSLTLRALLFVPLLAVGVDQARAALACKPGAESCLEAAGRGWLGAVGSVLLVLYAAALALGISGLARGRSAAAGRPPGFLRLWLLGTVGVAAVCGGQALLADALGGGTALGGGWVALLAFCALAGAVLAFALRVAPAAEELVGALRPRAPRPLHADGLARRVDIPLACRPAIRFALVTRGRGPPAPLD